MGISKEFMVPQKVKEDEDSGGWKERMDWGWSGKQNLLETQEVQ